MHILNELEDICKKTGEKIQGNCFTKHLDINKKFQNYYTNSVIIFH